MFMMFRILLWSMFNFETLLPCLFHWVWLVDFTLLCDWDVSIKNGVG